MSHDLGAALHNFPSLCMQATAFDHTKGRGIESRKILEHIPCTPFASFPPVRPRTPLLPRLYPFLPLSPSDLRFFSSRDLPRVTRARYYIGRSVGRSRRLLPLSAEVCQEFIESIVDISEPIPSRLSISWTDRGSCSLYDFERIFHIIIAPRKRDLSARIY